MKHIILLSGISSRRPKLSYLRGNDYAHISHIYTICTDWLYYGGQTAGQLDLMLRINKASMEAYELNTS